MHRLIVLTLHPDLATPRRFLAAGRALGIEVEIATPRSSPDVRVAGSRLLAPLAGTRLLVPLAGTRLLVPLAGTRLIVRIGAFTFAAALKEHRRLVQLGAVPLQRRRALLDASDQWRALRRAGAAGIPVPPSRLVRSPEDATSAVAELAGPPWFVKARRGSQGTQVLLASDANAAVRACHLFWGTGASCLVQEDLRPRGRVERHLVAGGELVASAIATPAAGEHRTNVHRGGRLSLLAPEAARGASIALRAVNAVGLPYAAVDTIGEDEPALLEVNASPGLQSLERVTGRDLATPLLARLLQRRCEG